MSRATTYEDVTRAHRVSAPSGSLARLTVSRKNELKLFPLMSYLTSAIKAHTATRVDAIDARRRDRTFLRVFSSLVTGSQSNRPRSVNARRRFASSKFRSSRAAGDDSERSFAGVARRDEAAYAAARAGRVGSKHSDRNSTLASAV